MKEFESRLEGLISGGSSSADEEVRSLLEQLRDDQNKNEWFRNKIVRNFLNENVVRSGVVPEAVLKGVESSNREAEALGLSASARQRFIDEISDEGAIKRLRTLLVSGNELMESAMNGGDVMQTFAQRNLHNNRYYYTKFTEWFITQLYIKKYEDAVVVDIGSAYNGFGKYAKNATHAKEINLVDLLNPPGRNKLEDRIYQIGSDAAKIEAIPSNYADIVCLHNAIEHFACGSDEGCLGELERMLRPGGKALISPFFFEGRYAISLNPISCFFYETASEPFVEYLVKEHTENNAILRFSYAMISPYAHVYDYTTIERKLRNNCPSLIPTFYKVELKQEELLAQEVFGIPFSEDLYDKPTFFLLELEKPA